MIRQYDGRAAPEPEHLSLMYGNPQVHRLTSYVTGAGCLRTTSESPRPLLDACVVSVSLCALCSDDEQDNILKFKIDTHVTDSA